MPASHDGYFIGTMPPDRFLKDFMHVEKDLPPTPDANFSKLAPGDSHTHDICSPLIRATKKSKLLPGLRLFVTRAKKRWHETSPNEEAQEGQRSTSDLCPTVSVRKDRTSHGSRKKGTNIAEYYSFATSLLGIEVRHTPAADPFADPEDYESSSTESPRGASTSPLSIKSRLLLNAPHPTSQGQRVTSLPTTPASNALPPDGTDHAPSAKSSSDQEKPNTPSSPRSSSYGMRNPVERDEEEGTAFRRSLTSHAQAQFARQHRSWFFQVVIVNRWARFVRWDRSGAVVSRRFDYVFEPEILADFLWRFAHMTDEDRGLDPTVTLASKEEIRLFESSVKSFLEDMNGSPKHGKLSRRLPGAEDTLDRFDTYPTWKIHVVNEASGEGSDVIIRRPFAGRSALLGRATRAYIAYDLREQRLVFLKDAWRLDHPKLRPEFDTYQNLKRHGVPYIPEIIYGGDVLDGSVKAQQTLSQDYASVKEEWRISVGSCERHIHHRLVQDIAYPLESAISVEEFVRAVHDTLCAISKAYDAAGLLHRDLSTGNVMIDSLGRGLLNDWDHAGGELDTATGIGTWRFMPISLLQDPSKVHDIVDDLEALFWVFVYCALQLYALPDQDRPMDIFDYQIVDPRSGRRRGGLLKHDCLFGNRLLQVNFTSEVLQKLISLSKRIWLAFYIGRNSISVFDSHPEAKADLLEKRKQAGMPSFWVETFTKALQELVDEAATQQTTYSSTTDTDSHSVLPNTLNNSSPSQSSRKRKASDEEPFATHASGTSPRRSKRLKVVHGRAHS